MNEMEPMGLGAKASKCALDVQKMAFKMADRRFEEARQALEYEIRLQTMRSVFIKGDDEKEKPGCTLYSLPDHMVRTIAKACGVGTPMAWDNKFNVIVFGRKANLEHLWKCLTIYQPTCIREVGKDYIAVPERYWHEWRLLCAEDISQGSGIIKVWHLGDIIDDFFIEERGTGND